MMQVMSIPVWTKEKISHAFQRFFDENGHYPTCFEIDTCPYLPAARTLQRRFSGAKGFREFLGLSVTDYTVGDVRSVVSKAINQRGLTEERIVYQKLISRFGEVFVHEQKPFAAGRRRVDFFVYTKEKRFGVDIFYPNSYTSLVRCINIKERGLIVDFPLILLVANLDLSQKQISDYVAKRKRALPANVEILSMKKFDEFIEFLTPLILQEL